MLRRLTVPLEEEDWRRFLQSHPEPIEWIVRQIKASLERPAAPLPGSKQEDR